MLDIVEREINRTAFPEITHLGFILEDLEGRLLLRERPGNPYGVTTTFPRTRLKPGETHVAALWRLLQQEVMPTPQSIFPIGRAWKSPHSTTRYFAGLVDLHQRWHSSAPPGMSWHSASQASEQLNRSVIAGSRDRDLAVLDAVEKSCLSPFRRILLTVREFHRLGFERLRAMAYFHGNGAWRCAIVPASCVSGRQGRFIGWDPLHRLADLSRTSNQDYIYTGASYQSAFGWSDACFDGPAELARKYLARTPAVAYAGWGRDPAYVEWFQELLEATAPHGVFFGWDESAPDPEDAVVTLVAGTEGRFRLPPPGEAVEE